MKPRKIISSCLQRRFGSKFCNKRLAVILFACLVFVILPGNGSAQLIRKSQVYFFASDSLLVTADLYFSQKSNPYIILFHQEKSCKGEFDSIAPRFVKMNYNCLAVDLRSGDNLGFLKNETARRAREGNFSFTFIDALKDVEAAIKYLTDAGEENLCLYGSESSASLSLIAGRDDDNVKSVIAFSPGNYFSPEYELKNILSNYPKPVFVGCTTEEYNYLPEVEGFPGHDRIIFKPSSGNGLRGSFALLSENPTRDEYWLSLLIFFKSLQ